VTVATVKPRFTIREYEPADEAPVLGLLNLTLGSGRAFERSTAFFRWKHRDNPFGQSLMLLADDDRIVGLRAFLRWQFRARGQTVLGVRAVDTATHPQYQRMGIFSNLTAACLERARATGVHLVFNTPNRYSMPGYLKLGWTHVGRALVFVRPLHAFRMVRSVLGSRWRGARNGTGDGEQDTLGRWRSVDDMLQNEPGVTDLLARDDVHLADGVRTARSTTFLRWRYAQVPSLQYGAHWVGAGRPQAAVIFRLTHRRGLSELMVCELLMADERHGQRVVRELLGLTRADYAVAHCAWNTPHRRVLLRTGFLPLPGGPHLTIRPLADDLGFDPTSFASWRLALGDLEVF
jgi:GNAT superfamily N-acetyltransferase